MVGPGQRVQPAEGLGYDGITVRTKDVKEPLTTWKQFFDLGEKYSGRIIAVNSQVDVFAAALKALGYSVNTEDSTQLDEMRSSSSAGRRISSPSTRTPMRSPWGTRRPSSA